MNSDNLTNDFDAEEIKNYLCELWRSEYPSQGCLPAYYSWKLKRMPLLEIVYGNPAGISREKVNNFIQLIQSGAVLQPLVCFNGELIDGYHRYHAYKKCGIVEADVYIND